MSVGPPGHDRGRITRHAALFFACILFLLSSGRTSSSDAGSQLQAAVLLATSGRLSLEGVPPPSGWARAPNGRFYQVHDIGNVLLMLPAAAAGAWLSARPPAELVADPPNASRAAASLICTMLAALACTWCFRLLAQSYPARTAFLLTLLLPAATVLVAYARAAWDVIGACCFMAGTLRFSASALRTGRRADLIAASAALGLSCTFRFSLLPFFAPAGAFVLWRERRRFSSGSAVLAAAAFLLVMAPSLAYNYVRTGAAWRPATALPQFLAAQNAIEGRIPFGVYGLLVSPGHGLFAFSPILLLVLTVPFVWKRFDADQRVLLGAFGAATGGYLMLIAAMRYGATFGWGPRYLVPVLPLVFYAAALAIPLLWARCRTLIVSLALLSCLIQLPAAVVNSHLAAAVDSTAFGSRVHWPFQQIAAWKTLARGLRGVDLPVPVDVVDDEVRRTTAVFPDLFLVRLARMSPLALAVSVGLAVACILLSAGASLRLLAERERAPAVHGRTT